MKAEPLALIAAATPVRVLCKDLCRSNSEKQDKCFEIAVLMGSKKSEINQIDTKPAIQLPQMYHCVVCNYIFAEV